MKYIHESKRPFILIDRYFPGEKFRFIVTDNKTGLSESIQVLKGAIPIIKQDINRMGNLVNEYLVSNFMKKLKKPRRRWQIKLPPEIIIP